MKFHDGTDFDADVVVWNSREDPERQVAAIRSQAGGAGPRPRADVGRMEGGRRVHGRAHHPGRRTRCFPTTCPTSSVRARHSGRSSARTGSKYAQQPVGTGPFKVDRVVPRERLELSRFDGYWDKARVPKLDKVLLFPDARGRHPHGGAAGRARSTGSRCRRPTPSRG